MHTINAQDGNQIYYKDYGSKEAKDTGAFPLQPLNSDNWENRENQMFFLANRGYRVVAHDRRGHGCSDQPWTGNDMNTHSDNLSQSLEYLDLEDVTLVGHSTDGVKSRDSSAVMARAESTMLSSSSSMFTLAGSLGSTAWVPGVKVSQGQIWSLWRQGMATGIRDAYECIEVFSKTDMREDLNRIDIPILVLCGDDDGIVPFDGSAPEAMKLLKKGTLKVFKGASHVVPNMYVAEVYSRLMAFLGA
ncbi:uncharacterized protein A1O9_11965 [Exophiala aquamarina CBS 119918]|uniref:AB hydrolase-1 domain-containing protein n=1 Tax=Exophiala aquamarina CBS 119918 TaxID=1182545 RepID=A0A072P8R7_9EURO|nr:uncharacterized protein A1O9_11965 [Exophiala aquamarina CBS 119918]KEF51975.1 hypothetical protein A1O9_11965 [Exophiala aquamarina CBS 119918]